MPALRAQKEALVLMNFMRILSRQDHGISRVCTRYHFGFFFNSELSKKFVLASINYI